MIYETEAREAEEREEEEEEKKEGELAQLARASALHAEGQRFESVILHKEEGGEREKGEREEATGGINTEGKAEASREKRKTRDERDL